MVAWRYEFYFLVLKTKLFYPLAVLVHKILFYHSKIKFIHASLHCCVIIVLYTVIYMTLVQTFIPEGAFHLSEMTRRPGLSANRMLQIWRTGNIQVEYAWNPKKWCISFTNWLISPAVISEKWKVPISWVIEVQVHDFSSYSAKKPI